MPGTPDLQDAFGQPSGQAPGCGFPVARVVAMFCWASGAVLEAVIGALATSELALWRTLWPTLLDPATYGAPEIMALYRDRWLIEMRFRDIKTTMGMDVLRGKSANVVRKEIHMHLLAYNLIRSLMWQAASEHGKPLHRLSLAGAVDRLNAMAPYLCIHAATPHTQRLYHLLLKWIANDTLPNRPNRIEPRAVKRRPKEYHLLNRPRHEMRKTLLCQ